MKPSVGFLPVDSMYPLLGENKTVASTHISASFASRTRNLDYDAGILKSRGGFVNLKTGTSSVDGTPIGIIDFEDLNGARHLVLVTTTERYKYEDSDGTWSKISDASSWTGDEDDVLDWTVIQDASGKYLVITNGVDAPEIWDGSGYFSDLDMGDSGITKVKTVESYYNRLVVGNVYAGAAWYKKDLVWSVPGDITDWTSVGSGSNMMPGLEGEIKKILRIGDRVAIYSEDSIGLMAYQGGAFPFSFSVVLGGIDLVSSRAIVSLGALHLFMSKENIYVFDGSSSLIPVGDPIRTDLRDHLKHDELWRAHATRDPSRRRVYWFYPRANDEEIEGQIYVQDYSLGDLRSSVWLDWDFYGSQASASGMYTAGVSPEWDDAAIAGETWDNLTYNALTQDWSYASRDAAPRELVVCNIGAEAAVYSETQDLDVTTPIWVEWESKDFTVPQAYRSLYARWEEIEFEAKGTSVSIYLSTDLGETWESTYYSKALTSSWSRYKIPIDIHSQSLRVKFSALRSQSYFDLKWLRVWFSPDAGR